MSLLKNVGIPSLLPWAFRKIRRLFRGENKRYLEFLKLQSNREEWLPKFFAGHELHAVYSADPEAVLNTLKNLSGNKKEIVREGAAKSWSRLLNRDFDQTYDILADLKRSNQYERRYTAALAPVQFYDDHASEQQKATLKSYWKEYEDDPRQGLWNLVRQRILEKRD